MLQNDTANITEGVDQGPTVGERGVQARRLIQRANLSFLFERAEYLLTPVSRSKRWRLACLPAAGSNSKTPTASTTSSWSSVPWTSPPCQVGLPRPLGPQRRVLEGAPGSEENSGFMWSAQKSTT